MFEGETGVERAYNELVVSLVRLLSTHRACFVNHDVLCNFYEEVEDLMKDHYVSK